MPLLRHTTRKHEQNSGGPTASVYLGAKARVAVARVAVARVAVARVAVARVAVDRVPRLLALGDTKARTPSPSWGSTPGSIRMSGPIPPVLWIHRLIDFDTAAFILPNSTYC